MKKKNELFFVTSSVLGRRVLLLSFLQIAGIVRGSVGVACINNLTFSLFETIF